jgi:hypothetical protein
MWIFLGALILTKISYLLLLPILIATFFLKQGKSLSYMSLLPAGLIILILGIINWIKFGSPFFTGYHAWTSKENDFQWYQLEALSNLLLNPQWSLFTHYPLVIISLFGIYSFIKKFRFEAVFILTISLVFFILIGGMSNWRGEWGYGPRYFLFILPLLSLPAAIVFTHFFSNFKPKFILPIVLSSALFLASAYAQIQIAKWDPLFFYWTKPDSQCLRDLELKKYFEKTHFAKIYMDYEAHKTDFTKIWYWPIIQRDCPRELELRHMQGLNVWTNRRNFYWERF